MDRSVHSAINFESAPYSAIHRRIFLGGAIGQYADGYILGTIGIAITLATNVLSLTALDMGLIAAASLIGILLGSLLIGPVVDRTGRRAIYVLSAIAFVILSSLQFFIADANQLIAIRLLVGIIIGIDYAVGVTLVSEWMPRRNRAKALGYMQCTWAAGYSCAYIVGYLLQSHGDESWRLVLVSCVVPSVLVLLARLGTPESPTWLTSSGRPDEALALVQKHLGVNYTVNEHIPNDGASGIASLFSKKLRTNTFVGAVFFAALVTPYFAISIFLPKIFESFNLEDPYLYGIVFNFFLFAGIVFGTYIVDKIKRRAFLISTFYLCAAVLFILTLTHASSQVATIVLISIFSFTISAAAVLCYAYPPELFPSEVRGTGVGFTVACSRIGAASGTFFLPIVLVSHGTSAALSICIFSLLLGGAVCQLLAPETSEQTN